ncbi:MAG: zinc ribbon domain-containing protein [Promethearchaeota archaeon]
MPVMYVHYWSYDNNYWIWGLVSTDRFFFNTESIEILVVGIVLGLTILICGVLLVISAILATKRRFSVEHRDKIWIISSLIAILAGIVWYFYISIFGEGYITPPGYNVWSYYTIGFGLTGTFSGGSMTILGYLFNRIIKDTDIMSFFVTEPQKEISVAYKKISSQEAQRTEVLERINFCPKCGCKTGETYKFCPGCGFKF